MYSLICLFNINNFVSYNLHISVLSCKVTHSYVQYEKMTLKMALKIKLKKVKQ